jgi:hypothetical protein
MTEAEGDTVAVTYIPFVREEENFVNASLLVKTTPTDTAFKYVCDWQYASYGFDTTATGWNANDVFHVFALMDNLVFGRNSFRIVDSNLLVAAERNALQSANLSFSATTVTRTLGSTGTGRGNGGYMNEVLMPVEVCTPISVCLWECPENMRGTDSNTTESLPCCMIAATYEVCTTVMVWISGSGEGGTGTGTGGTTTGGSGGTGYIPPECPGTVTPDNVTNPCGPGWNPVPPDPGEDPCITANAAAKKIDSVYIKSKADSAINAIPDLATGILERGFPIYKKIRVNPYNVTDTSIIGYRTGALQSGTDSNINIQSAPGYLELSAASLHTHPPNGYSAQSAKDVFEFIGDQLQDSHLEGAFVAAADGSQYALTITDNAAAAAFYGTMSQNLSGTKWNESSMIGKAFKKAYEYFENGDPTKKNFAYEMAMAAVLKQFNTGVTLNKKNVSGNFKPIVVNTAPDPRKPRRTIYTQDCL